MSHRILIKPKTIYCQACEKVQLSKPNRLYEYAIAGVAVLAAILFFWTVIIAMEEMRSGRFSSGRKMSPYFAMIVVILLGIILSLTKSPRAHTCSVCDSPYYREVT